MNSIFKMASLVAAIAASSATMAANPILSDLNMSFQEVEVMNDSVMSETRGAALIVGQPTPSVTHGLRKHLVTWKGFGSKADYQSYNYIGNSYTPDSQHNLIFTYNGGNYHVGGDQWLADDISSPSAWSASNAYLKEYHYQVLNPTTEAVTAYAFRETAWNRPISTFNW